MRRSGLLLLLVVSGCTRHREIGVPAAPIDPRLLSDLSMLAVGAPPSDADLLNAGRGIDRFVDTLLADSRFGAEVVPKIIFREHVIRPTTLRAKAFTLQQVTPSGSVTPIYYLREPCDPALAQSVRPWWEPSKDVLICPDSFRPDVWEVPGTARGEKASTSCDAGVASSAKLLPATTCGCGPNLMRCASDAAQFDQFLDDMRNELRWTARYVVQNDLPAATIFTSNETSRGRLAEFVYRTWEAEANRTAPDLSGISDWPLDGRWAPRKEISPGEFAGILTTPQIVGFYTDRRQRQRDIFEMIWCSTANSVGATAEAVLGLNTGNLQVAHTGWQALAAKPLCTDCHARLDYGWQFFLGFDMTTSIHSHYAPDRIGKGEGEMFGDDIDDPRGKAPLNPQGFAKLAIAQKEFARCMVQGVAGHIFGGAASGADIEAISIAFATNPTFKSAMRAGLLRRADEWADPITAPGPAADLSGRGAVATDLDAAIVIPPAVRHKLDDRCGSCHTKPTLPGEPALAAAALPARLLVDMTSQVAFQRMPREKRMSATERARLVGDLIDLVWKDEPSRSTARAFFVDQNRAVPAQEIDAAFRAIGGIAGVPDGEAWGSMERMLPHDRLQYTPAFAAQTAIEAEERCRRSGRVADALEECVGRATSPALLANDPGILRHAHAQP